ncbi:MAG: RagB/SusD family nutrient uptake outer membrane protein [Prevotella sp.]|nr:RagB/SusD family nutrient uptake outer membrane protein [Prevotella sp.]
MMNTKYINKVLAGSVMLLLTSSTLLLSSCDDYLDVSPSDKQTAAQTYASKTGFYTISNGIYDALSGDELYGKNMTWGAVDIMSKSYSTLRSSYEFKSLAANTYTDVYAAPVLSSMWGKAYELILNANILIDQIDKQNGILTKQEADCMKGEMLGVRAFLHLDMLRLFGPAPLVTIDKAAIPYNETVNVSVHDLLTTKEVCEKVINDLNAAEQLLQNDPIIENGPMMSAATGEENVQLRYRQYRMNYYAVKALKARAYYWMNDNENAYRLAKEIIEDNKIQQMFPQVDPNKLLANTSNPDRVFSSEQFFGVYDKDRDKVYDTYFSSNASNANRLQPYASFINSERGLFSHLILGMMESTDYRYQSQWELASGVGSSGHTFIKFKKIAQPDPDDEDSEYYFAKMIPLIGMQEMYYICAETAPTDEEKVHWYNAARVRRGCMDLEALGVAPMLVQYWPVGYGPILLSNEIRREFWGTGQWFYFTKHADIGAALGMTGAGCYYFSECGAEQNYGQLNIQPPLPVGEMK